jgi:hypothetical protein
VGEDPGVPAKTTGLFLFCWLVVNIATGGAHVGEGDGLGDGLGGGEGETPGDGDGFGLGEGDGLGDGGADGAPAGGGTRMTLAVASETKVMSGPPVKADRRGVTRWKWPVTLAVTRVPYEVLHAGEQERAMSPGPAATNEPWSSRVAAHMIGLAPLHPAALFHVVGSFAASNAATRAAFATVIRA